MNALASDAMPPGVVAATVFAPAVPPGVSAVICVGERTVTLVAVTPPTMTALALVRFFPVMVISVPPANAPVFGFTDVIVGVGTVAPRNPATLALAALTNL